MEETCVSQGWEFVVYLGNEYVSFERVKPIADDPDDSLGPYYQEHVAGKNWLHLSMLSLWLGILITFVAWRSYLLGRLCCCREIPAKLNRIECYKMLTDGWAILNKVVFSLFGILVIAACVCGISSLASKQFLASDGSKILDSAGQHFRNFLKTGSDLSQQFDQLPEKIESQIQYDNDTNQIQQKLLQIELALIQLDEVITDVSKTVDKNILAEILVIKNDYDSNVKNAFEIFHLIAVYIIFPVVIFFTLIAVVLGCVNCVLGIEITMFFTIISTVILIGAGAFMSAIAVTENDVCAQVDTLVLYKLEKDFQSSDLFINFVQNMFITKAENPELFLDQSLNLNVNRLFQEIDQIEADVDQVLEEANVDNLEIQNELFFLRENAMRFVGYLNFEQLNPYYNAFKEISCCDFKDYLIRYNLIAFLVSIFMLPVIFGLLTLSHKLQKLPPPMVTCGACRGRSGKEFEINVPSIPPRESSPRILNYQIFSRSRRQTESVPPTLYADNETIQNSQLIVNVPQSPADKNKY